MHHITIINGICWTINVPSTHHNHDRNTLRMSLNPVKHRTTTTPVCGNTYVLTFHSTDIRSTFSSCIFMVYFETKTECGDDGAVWVWVWGSKAMCEQKGQYCVRKLHVASCLSVRVLSLTVSVYLWNELRDLLSRKRFVHDTTIIAEPVLSSTSFFTK